MEGVISFQNAPAGWSDTVDGWPAFWATATNGSVEHVETDFFEYMTAGNSHQFNFGFIDWLPNGSHVGAGDIGIDGTVNMPVTFDPSQRHTYGFLWVPATATSAGYAKLFVDGQNVGPTYTWTQTSGQFRSIDANTLQLIFGTGTANPMTVYSVAVWQKNASANVTG